MKIKILTIIFASLSFLFAYTSSVSAQDSTQSPKTLEIIEGEGMSINEHTIDVDVIKKDNTELNSLILRENTMFDIEEIYKISVSPQSTYKIRLQNIDFKSKPILSLNNKVFEFNLTTDNSIEYLSWEFNPEDIGGNTQVNINLKYKFQSQRDDINSFDVLNYNFESEKSIGRSSNEIKLSLNFPYKITDDTFKGPVETGEETVIPNTFTLNQNSLLLNADIEKLGEQNSLVVKFLPERINTNFIDSKSILSQNPNSQDALLKRIQAYSEFLLYKDSTKTDVRNSPIFSELSNLITNLYKSNTNNPQISIEYAYILTTLTGSSSDDKFINELLTISLAQNAKNVKGIETKYLYNTNQRNSNFHENFLPFDITENSKVFFSSGKYDYVKDSFKNFEWENSQNFNQDRVTSIETYRNFISSSATNLKSLNDLSIITNNPKYSYLYINTLYLEDFLLGNFEFNISTENNNVLLNLKNYTQQDFDEIKLLSSKYLENDFSKVYPLPILLLNLFDPEKYEVLTDNDSTYNPIQEENPSTVNTLTSKPKTTNEYYLQWFNDDVQFVFGLLVVTFILVIFYIRFKVNLFELFGSARKNVKTFLKPNVKPEKPENIPLLDSEGEVIGSPFIEDSENPLKRPTGLMD